jgi:hypothetical protein
MCFYDITPNAKAPAIVRKAYRALKVAVAKVVEAHRRSGAPLVV